MAASSMERRIRFHEMRQSGVSPEDLVQIRRERHRQIIDKKIEQIAQALLGRQHEAASIIDNLIRELEVIDPLEAAKLQNEFLIRSVERLQTIEENVTRKLEPVEKEQNEQQEAKKTLLETLSSLRRALEPKGPQETQLQRGLYTGGARISQYVSSHTGVS